MMMYPGGGHREHLVDEVIRGGLSNCLYFLLSSISLHTTIAAYELLSPPMNVSVSAVYEDGALISWSHHPSPYIRGLEITIWTTVPPSISHYHRRFHIQVSSARSSYTVVGLARETSYHVIVHTLGTHGVYSAASDIISFHTYSGTGRVPGVPLVDLFDVLIVFCLVVAWLCSIAVFVNRWSRVRILPPVKSRLKPMNLHRIKVIKRSSDSVIYRSYSKKYKSTMAMRERRIRRMSTVPAIKFELSVLQEIHAENRAAAAREREHSGYIEATTDCIAPLMQEIHAETKATAAVAREREQRGYIGDTAVSDCVQPLMFRKDDKDNKDEEEEMEEGKIAHEERELGYIETTDCTTPLICRKYTKDDEEREEEESVDETADCTEPLMCIKDNKEEEEMEEGRRKETT